MSSNFPDDSLKSCNSLLKEIEQYVKKNPDNKKWQYELSKCHSRAGNIQFSQGHIKMGTDSFLSALNILEQLAKVEPENINWHYELCRTYEILGNFLQLNEDLDFAELFYSQAVGLRKKLQGENHPEYIICFNTLVNLYISMNKTTHAESLLKQQMTVFEKMTEKNPPGYALCLDQFAGLYEKMGNYTESQLLYLEVVSVKKKIFGDKHPEYEAALNKLNNLYRKSGSLNSIYGNMKNAMMGNPALTSMDKMLEEADIVPVSRAKKSENVNFAVSFPPTMYSAESYILDVWLFLEEQRNILLNRIKEENSDEIKIKSEGNVIIERGTTITARLAIENLVAEPAERTLTWNGELNNSSFIIRVPENSKEGSKIGQVYFYINGLEVSRLHFKVLIASMQKDEKKQKNDFALGTKYKTAFASYASDDRNDVLARVQGLEMAGIDVFLDVRNLRSGERYEEKLLEKIRATDVFYLFWSSAAKKI